MFPRINNESVERFVFCTGTLPQNRGNLLLRLHDEITYKLGRVGDSISRTWIVSDNRYAVAVELRAGRSPGWSGYRLEAYLRQYGLTDVKILNYREAVAVFSELSKKGAK